MVLPAMAMTVIPVGIALGLLAVAAWRDVALRLIPDWISIVLALLGAGTRLASGWLDLAFSAVMALVVFFLLVMAFSRGLLGGGDVKLASALVLWLSPPDCYYFLMVTAMAGGILALLHLALRGIGPMPALEAGGGRVLRVELRRIRAGGPLPYGVAIMAGGYYVLLRTLGI